MSPLGRQCSLALLDIPLWWCSKRSKRSKIHCWDVLMSDVWCLNWMFFLYAVCCTCRSILDKQLKFSVFYQLVTGSVFVSSAWSSKVELVVWYMQVYVILSIFGNILCIYTCVYIYTIYIFIEYNEHVQMWHTLISIWRLSPQVFYWVTEVFCSTWYTWPEQPSLERQMGERCFCNLVGWYHSRF